ncbi:hypothetical protein SKUN_001581 [Spiroplasma kunkelii CR2-3x]|uniref:Uncharacterized protein n=2 Tax=Spiroplasma kunkelii TaxID=47834 RepID=A0A0K2JIL6_SPIKU|nr:hypothetical protein SKUN_001581 [Spiroplasma kunkelii CR2-3x]
MNMEKIVTVIVASLSFISIIISSIFNFIANKNNQLNEVKIDEIHKKLIENHSRIMEILINKIFSTIDNAINGFIKLFNQSNKDQSYERMEVEITNSNEPDIS